MDVLEKMKMMKKKREMSPVEKSAKMSVMKGIQNEMSKAMGGKLSGLKKVTVASDSPQGLEKGLETAKDIVEPLAEEPGMHEMPEGEMMADGEMAEEASELEGLSSDEIDAKIQELLEAKKRLEAQK